MFNDVLTWLLPFRKPTEGTLVDRYCAGFQDGYLAAYESSYQGLEEGTAEEKIGHRLAWHRSRRKEVTALLMFERGGKNEV